MIDYGYGVHLGPIDRCHLDRIRKWRNCPHIWKWCRQNDLISDAQQDDWFERQFKDPTIKMYLIHIEGASYGVCGLTSIDHCNRRAEFSLYIDPGFHRRGLGKKALQTLLSHGFNNLSLNLIWGESFDGNPAIKMFESLGMKKEGTRRQFYFKDGRFIDAHLFSITSREWLK